MPKIASKRRFRTYKTGSANNQSPNAAPNINRLALAVAASISIVSMASHAFSSGYEFQVNTYTSDSQNAAAVAMDADGDFVVVWSSDGTAVITESMVSALTQFPTSKVASFRSIHIPRAIKLNHPLRWMRAVILL